MATSSITNTIVLSDSKQVEKFLNAVEKSIESQSTQKKVVSGRQLSKKSEIKAFMNKRRVH